jgi:hypothetical protein
MPYIEKSWGGRIRKLKASYVKCLACGKRFLRINSTIRRRNFCNVVCRGIGLKGKNNPFYKGGRYKHANGYMYVTDVRSKSGYLAEHRIVMEQHLGRPLYRWEIVHHKNSIGTDNRIENLELISHCHNGDVETQLKAEIKRLQGILEENDIRF